MNVKEAKKHLKKMREQCSRNASKQNQENVSQATILLNQAIEKARLDKVSRGETLARRYKINKVCV